MGETVLPPPATFDATIVMVAIIVHLILSIVLAFAFAWALSLWRISSHVVFGVVLA